MPVSMLRGKKITEEEEGGGGRDEGRNSEAEGKNKDSPAFHGTGVRKCVSRGRRASTVL